MRLGVLLLALAALVQPSAGAELVLWLSGDAYQGGPSFEVALDGAKVGEGVVDPLPAPGEAAEFRFEVDDGLAGELSIRLTNDVFEGKGKDRNLAVYGARLGQVTAGAADFRILRKGQPVERNLKNGLLGLWSSQERAVAMLGAVAPTPAAAEPGCSASVSLLGVAPREGLSEAQMGALGKIVEAARSGRCRIEVDGYASQGGAADRNLMTSQMRADIVLDYLAGKANFTAQSATGHGATSEFGGDDRSNERVVVTLSAR